ncbi:MAG TPA: hypothetical protein VNA19_09995 [Pyrinomonadaceae bacterium]|nr:hypothetical protein [Pyrinomonadaceae bacterium]
MRNNLSRKLSTSLTLIFASLCCAGGFAQVARAQFITLPPAQEVAEPAKVLVTEKFDEYGDIRHCDESARLDNFAIALQNESKLKGYLLIYVGKDDLPGKIPSILARAQGYLTNERGLAAERLTVVNAGYRAQRTVELWVVAPDDPAPTPTDTIIVNRDENEAYLFNHGYVQDDDNRAEDWDALNPDAETAEQSANEAEPTPDEIANEVQATEETAAEETPVEEPSFAEPPRVPATNISLLWNAGAYVEALRARANNRACIIYYNDPEQYDARKMHELVEAARAELSTKHGIKPDKIVTIFGGYAGIDAADMELWVVPEKAALPVPKVYKKPEPEAQEDVKEATREP